MDCNSENNFGNGNGTVTDHFRKLMHRVIIMKVSVSTTALVIQMKKYSAIMVQSLTQGIRANSRNVVCMKTYLQQFSTFNVLTSS